jgi:HicB family
VEPSPKAGAPRSGKLLVRMPASLHDELAKAAAAEGVSLNQLITSSLASAVGWRGSGEAAPTAPENDPDPSRTTAETAPVLSPRVTQIALVANLVVLAIAAVAAIALLIAAWQAGF